MPTEEFTKIKDGVDAILLDLASLDSTPTGYVNTRKALLVKLRAAIKALEEYAQREHP